MYWLNLWRLERRDKPQKSKVIFYLCFCGCVGERCVRERERVVGVCMRLCVGGSVCVCNSEKSGCRCVGVCV